MLKWTEIQRKPRVYLRTEYNHNWTYIYERAKINPINIYIFRFQQICFHT
jgi:hypothetical protein